VPGKSTAPGATPTATGGTGTGVPAEPFGTTDNGKTAEDEGVLGGLLGDLF
jgi:hypothetical protein